MQIEVIENCTLVRGDSMEAQYLIEGKAQAVISDPPYKLQSGGKSDSHYKSKGKFADYDNSGRPVICNITWMDIFEIIDTISAPDSDQLIMTIANNENLFQAMQALRFHKFRDHNTLVWDKGYPTPNRWVLNHLEFILYTFKGKARTCQNTSQKQLIPFGRTSESTHKTEKPVGLMEILVDLVLKPGELCADPFLGAGSTAVACAKRGVHFWGCEIDQEYFDQACKRVEAAYKQRDFFTPHYTEQTALL